MDVSSELMYVKDYRKGVYQKSYVAMDRILEELAKRLKLSIYETKYLVFDEMRDALLSRSADKYKDLLRYRIKKCCYVVVDGEISVWHGDECEKKILEKIGQEKILESMPTDQKEIKGLVAFGGKARGTVKIVLVEKDVAKVQDGDILVSSSTNPDLIIAMKKSAAIITDTGGIVSHAAIVSRELKKPCIVGTRIATHLLKDGDMVEVDAERGLVTKLN
jgi:phosphohistidine swiveling domain-containing protein